MGFSPTQKAMAIAPKFTGFLSICSSTFIIFYVLRDRKRRNLTVRESREKLVWHMIWCNFWWVFVATFSILFSLCYISVSPPPPWNEHEWFRRFNDVLPIYLADPSRGSVSCCRNCSDMCCCGEKTMLFLSYICSAFVCWYMMPLCCIIWLRT